LNFLIVEDDPDAAEAIEISVGIGWPEARIVVVETGEDALTQISRQKPDLILLDINLPDIDGYNICKRIRSNSDIPIIMISARDSEFDKVKGLELGGDDYITKPFGHMELIARIKAVLRRVNQDQICPEELVIETDVLRIDCNRHQVLVNAVPVELTPTEYNLLCLMARNAGKTLGHQMLLTSIWGKEYQYETEYIKVYIRRLRNKIEPNPQHPRFILTEWGVGYRFEVNGPA
jgi:DNA-binding response OmpR family regulator